MHPKSSIPIFWLSIPIYNAYRMSFHPFFITSLAATSRRYTLSLKIAVSPPLFPAHRAAACRWLCLNKETIILLLYRNMVVTKQLRWFHWIQKKFFGRVMLHMIFVGFSIIMPPIDCLCFFSIWFLFKFFLSSHTQGILNKVLELCFF